jgi:hypothetical protein
MDIIGKWVQIEGQPYAGLFFEFNDDGTFTAQYDAMGIKSGGTYEVEGKKITMDQKYHTFNLVGTFKGLINIKDEELRMALAGGANQEPPKDLSDARIYKKLNSKENLYEK